MKNEALKKRLSACSKDILLPENFHDKLALAVMAYADLLFDNFTVENNEGRTDVKTQYGNAIGTFWAARCVREVFRTQRFSRGLYSSILKKIGQGKKPVHVLYAGTGPFATLALPIMMMLKPEEVQFTCLEINPESIDKLKQVIEFFGLGAYIKSIKQCDAALWEVDNKTIDIVISETMNRALITEPQVAIMLNLASQLSTDVIFLPEEIKVSVSKMNRKERKPESIKELINFNRSFMQTIIQNSVNREWVFPQQNVQVTISEEEQLYYLTEIKVNDGNTLHYNESSLNLLEKIKTHKKHGSLNLNFKYSVVGKPGFIVAEINT